MSRVHPSAIHDREILVSTDGVQLAATLNCPPSPRGLVIFAHGSGSSRHSPRNRFVAGILQQSGLATLLMDLLTGEEEAVDLQTAELRFDISLLARRLVGATDWAQADVGLGDLPLGYFGASTGAGAALMAAAERPAAVKAVVSRGGRPDLAGDALERVTAPTLLIVGGADSIVITLNREALAALVPHTVARLEIVPGATHLFEELGTLDVVADLAADWFVRHLRAAPAPPHAVGAGPRSTGGR